MASFLDYLKRAEARAEEERRLGLATFEQIEQHRTRKFILGEHYRERDSGTWREAEEYLKRKSEKKGGSQ